MLIRGTGRGEDDTRERNRGRAGRERNNYQSDVYVDEKLDYYTTDIFKRLDKKYQKEKQFKEKIVELFKKHKIGSSEDLAFLDGLVQGS